MIPTTKRLLTSCGLYLAIQIPVTIVSVTHGLDGVLSDIPGGKGAMLVALFAFMLLASSGLARREAYS